MYAAIIADDLTGANDTAVQFAREGWDSKIRLDHPPSPRHRHGGMPGFMAIARTADNRASAAAVARQATADAVQAALSEGADRLYIKVDSTLRGSVADQVAAALGAWSTVAPQAIAVICPAYPLMGRTVVDGELQVNGVPVAHTHMAQDPVTPVRASLLTELIPGATRAAASDIAAAPAGAMLICDAVTADDLAVLARAIACGGRRVVAVGSAGLGLALARAWSAGDAARTRHTAIPSLSSVRSSPHGLHVVQVTSRNEVSHAQADLLLASLGERALACEFSLEDLSDADRTHAVLQERLRAWPHREPEGGVLVLRASRDHSIDFGSPAARRIAEQMGEATATLVRDGRVRTLGLVGGDGARAVLRALGVSSMTVVSTAAEGIPIARADDGSAPGLLLWTKAGGFGEAQALSRVLAATQAANIDPSSQETEK